MNEKLKKSIKKMGALAFVFFLVKGLVWIAIGYLGYEWFT
jgi:hypothetical protein